MEPITIISLNTAGSRFGGVESFLLEQSPYQGGDTDYPYMNNAIYCFQEVIASYAPNTLPDFLGRKIPYYSKQGEQCNYESITKTLTRYIHHFSAHEDFLGTWAPDGNMISLKYLSDFEQQFGRFCFGSQVIFSLAPKGKNVTLQWMVLGADETDSFKKGFDAFLQPSFLVANVHGIWENSIKTDTAMKLFQSERIIQYMRYLKFRFPYAKQILCGDFNLIPETESIKRIEQAGFINLVKEYHIMSTRTPHYAKEIKHADYIFEEPGITVHSFKTMSDVVSDHAPLQLTFTIP